MAAVLLASRFCSARVYRFDEGQGQELKDSSGHNHHGKIVGAKWAEAAASSAPGKK